MAAGRASPASRRRAAIGHRLFGLVAPVCGALIRPRIAATPLLLASLSLPGLRGPAPGLSAHRVDPGQRAGRPVVVPRGPRPRLACSLSSALSRSVDRSPLRLAVGIVAPRSSRLSPAPVSPCFGSPLFACAQSHRSRHRGWSAFVLVPLQSRRPPLPPPASPSTLAVACVLWRAAGHHKRTLRHSRQRPRSSSSLARVGRVIADGSRTRSRGSSLSRRHARARCGPRWRTAPGPA